MRVRGFSDALLQATVRYVYPEAVVPFAAIGTVRTLEPPRLTTLEFHVTPQVLALFVRFVASVAGVLVPRGVAVGAVFGEWVHLLPGLQEIQVQVVWNPKKRRELCGGFLGL